jgi:nucleotide-binding universal stress UspA family protein
MRNGRKAETADMSRQLLVATDGSALSRRAASVAIGLAKSLGATVVGCAALPVYPYHGVGEAAPAEATFQAAAAAAANRHLDDIETAAKAAGVAFRRVLREGHPDDIILQTADTEQCELIVMASHGRRGVTSLLLGSETSQVLARSDRPVLVVR